MDVVPQFTLPPNGQSRTRWLTQSEAARLLWAAHGSDYHKHLIRFILIGLYTGTRHRAILSLQWMPNTIGGWIDLERGVMHRRGTAERESNKKRPPVRIPSRLLFHMSRWHRADNGLRHIIRFEGKAIKRIEKAFRGVRAAAGLSDDVTPHVLRHTFCTWLAQAGVPVWEAAGMAGMTVQTFEAVYGHHSPDFQKRAAEAF
jgi:integrase